MAESPAQVSEFEFLGGSACLNFANTLSGIRGGETSDSLEDYLDLLSWATQADLVTKARRRELEEAIPRNAQRIAQIFARSLALREAIYRIFSSVAAGKTVPAEALSILNDELIEAMTNARVVVKERGFDWQLPPEVCGLYLPLQAVARDAAELLTSRHLKEVRECSGETCSWLFLDATRNHSRLWCDMRVCGNRMKQTRYRNKSASTKRFDRGLRSSAPRSRSLSSSVIF